MEGKTKIPYFLAGAVLLLLVGGIIGEQTWKWYDGPRRVTKTRKALDELSKGFHNNTTFIVNDYNGGHYKDGWGNPIRKETDSGGNMVFRSAGPDEEFGTDDDFTMTTSPPRPLPLPEKKKTFLGK